MRAALGVALILFAGCREPIVTAPSLLLITTDAIRADSLTCYDTRATGGQSVCGVAEHGALFVWAFSTEPDRAPAAATLLTSLPAEEHAITTNAASFLPSNTWTVAAELARAGLATAAFVSAPELNRSRNLQLGFDHFELSHSTRPGASAAATTAAFERWLKNVKRKDQAWFAWLHYPAVHSRPGPLASLSLDELDRQVAGAIAAARSVTRPNELGLAFSALAGDPGDDEQPLALARVRIPLLWSPPGGVAPQTLAAPVALLDLAPSLLQQAGVLVPARLLGEPLRVSPLPPAEARPARPLRLASGNEVGVVLSRRYYARARQHADGAAARARTALLPDDGAAPRESAVRVDSEAARAYETELGFPAGLEDQDEEAGLDTRAAEDSFHANGTEVPLVRSSAANAVAGAAPNP